ncbi:MAG: hypothetical protein IKL13_03065 [Clostridia bacterium]|nr:hypothetical protein [Clostridia bacterium]
MKKTFSKALLSLLCAITMLMAMVPLGAISVSAVGYDFPWTKENTLLEDILQRDGLLDGIWYPWINAGRSGHNLSGNDVMAKYYDTNGGRDWATVELDRYGADNVYREIYNLKAMGYNMMAWGGSIYGEGVIFDDHGDVLGIKQDYLDNARRLLDMCREIGMPVMWNIYFHSDACTMYYGTHGWDILTRMVVDPTVSKHYAERFVKPLCEMLNEYPDVVALISIADEPENEINDSEMGNHFEGGRAHYGVNRDDMVYFMKQINDMVKKVMPGMPRTVASNARNKAIYSGFDLDLMGLNKYNNNGDVDATTAFFTAADMLLMEYNVDGDLDVDDEDLTKRLIAFREGFMAEGYAGGFSWCWIPNATDAAYYLLNKRPTSQTDFKAVVTNLRHYIDDYRAEHQGKTITLDKPVLYANDGSGLVEWIPSRQATKMTLERSDDGGKTWKALLTDVDPAQYVNAKKKGAYRDTTAPKSGFCYRITVKDDKGNTVTSDPNDVAGTDQKYYKTYKFEGVDYATGTHYEKSILSKTEKDKARIIHFGVAQNRPYEATDNLFLNSDFEGTGGQWNNATFLKNAKVVTDSTAVSGNKSLCFDTTSVKEGTWYKFTVNVEKNTDYTLSTWIKGAYLGPNNAGHASFGVYDEALGGFMVYWEYYRDYARASRLTQQIYPNAWDEEWHLRSVTFNSGDQTQVTIALYGYGSKMWLDDIALFKSDAGVRYTGKKTTSYLSYKYYVDCATCDPAKSILKNVRMDDSKSTFWQDGDGWRNGFLSIVDNKYEYGKSLKYTASSNPIGNYYTKWIDLKPKTEYVFSASIKILKSGKGKLAILEDQMNQTNENLAIELDAEMFGDDWFQYSIRFNSSHMDRIAIAICDLGGSALFDNIRLFEVSDAKVVEDPYKDKTGSTVAPPTATVKPTVKPTTTQKPTSTITSTTVALPTDPTETDPTDVVVDPTQPADPTTPVDPTQPGDPTAPADDGEDADAGTTAKKDTPWLFIGIGVGALVLIAGGIVVFLLLRKKKAE